MENDKPKPSQAWLARMQAHRGLRLLGSLAVAVFGIYALYVMAGHVTCPRSRPICKRCRARCWLGRFWRQP